MLNPLMGTLKPQSYGPLYSNTVIGTLAVDGSVVTLGTARRGLGAESPRSPLLAVPNVTAYPSTDSVPTSSYSMTFIQLMVGQMSRSFVSRRPVPFSGAVPLLY